MYAIMCESITRKEILNSSLCERSDEILARLIAVAIEYKEMFPDTHYYVVKIDMEIVK